MAYERTEWKNREVEHPRRFIVTDNGDGTVIIESSPGNVLEPGTPIIAANMNNIEEGILYAIEQGGKVKSVNGKTGEVVIDVGDIEGLNSQTLKLGQGASAKSYAVALGYNASGQGYSSIAIGQGAKTPQSGTIAIGWDTSAIGFHSMAIGNDATALEENASAIGRGASAPNLREGVIGVNNNNGSNKWIVPGAFTVQGTKNFEIPHPKPEKKATHVIRHGAVESPTAGDTLYRYKVQATKDNDIVTIDLPDYFIWLNKNVQIFVTPQGHFGNGYGILNRETEQLEIHCEHEGEYNVLVIGTRNDNHQSVQDWNIKGVEREIGESWTGETYVFEVDEIMEVEEIKEVV